MFGRDIKIDRDRTTPVEIHERRAYTRETEWRVPVIQALTVAVGVGTTLLTGIVATRAIGPVAFWLGAFIVSFSTFVYMMRVAFRQEMLDWRDPIASFLLALFNGFVFYCLWRMSMLALPAWPIRARFLNILVAIPFVICVVFTVLIGAAFTLELLQRSPFMEQSIYGAIGEALKEALTIRWREAARRPRDPIIIRGGNGNGRGLPRNVPEYPVGPEVGPPPQTPEERLAHDLRYFIVAGARRGYGRRRWVGIPLPSGGKMTDARWRKWTGWLESAGILMRDGGGFALAVPLGEALERIQPPPRGLD